MSTITLTPAGRIKAIASPGFNLRTRGAQPGNQNYKEATQTAKLHQRCDPVDKGNWTRAANLAVKKGTLTPDHRGNLSGWVVQTLNAAAKEQLPRTQYRSV